jgi:hypothetical protein
MTKVDGTCIMSKRWLNKDILVRPCHVVMERGEGGHSLNSWVDVNSLHSDLVIPKLQDDSKITRLEIEFRYLYWRSRQSER